MHSEDKVNSEDRASAENSADNQATPENQSAAEESNLIITRRRFLGGVATTAAGVIIAPYAARAVEQNSGKNPDITSAAPSVTTSKTLNTGKKLDKLKVAFVGTGGRAESHVNDLAEPDKQNVVCFADVDEGHWKKVSQLAPNAKGYTDWRKMMDEHLDEVDVVIVAVPDHSHAGPAMRAIRSGKHVYCEKPLTWSIEEARALGDAAAHYRVATQMGNQGHSMQGNRLVVEWVRGGVIGDVTEIHTWTNRPIWPQGNLKRGPVKPVPAGLNWDAWLGPAPFRDYTEAVDAQGHNSTILPFNWRGWFDYGCGAIGDMGCHTWDQVFWAMEPDYPSSVTLLQIDNKGTETFAAKTHFKWEFPAKNGRPAFTSHWYSGGMKPAAPEEYINDPAIKSADGKKRELPGSATLWIGTKGKLLVQGDYADNPRLIPESFMKQAKLPDPWIPRSPGHMAEFVMAAKGEKPWDYPGSSFASYAAPLTEVLLLGAIAEKIGEVGFTIECDPVWRRIKTKAALDMVGREYRKGWELQS